MTIEFDNVSNEAPTNLNNMNKKKLKKMADLLTWVLGSIETSCSNGARASEQRSTERYDFVPLKKRATPVKPSLNPMSAHENECTERTQA